MSPPRRFSIRTYGCQMNVHDSQKVSNLLHHDGWSAADSADSADLLIINTCSIRDKAEHRLYSELGKLREWKSAQPGRIIGVAGCVAQQQGDALLLRFSQLDFVYGTHNLRRVPSMVEAALAGHRGSKTDEASTHERFDLPAPHRDLAADPAGRAYVTVMEGCDMFCSFCIVPFTRGREISRHADAIVSEARALVDRGVREITLLGQTVNAYGRHALRRARATGGELPNDVIGFAELLAELDALPGLRRLRYISPHPAFFDETLIRAHGDLESLCPHIHLPVQSGSDRILERMRRRYTAGDYRKLVDQLRDSRPDLAITTDLIVGFPGETDSDFEDTLGLVRDVGFTDSFIFKYSPRPKTAAAPMDGAVAADVAQQRLEQLQNLQRSLTLAAHRTRVGERTQVLVEGVSHRGGNQRYGRDPYNRVVNFPIQADDSIGRAEPGRLLEVDLVDATPHSLIGEPVSADGQGTSRARNRQPVATGVKLGAGSADGNLRDTRVSEYT